MEDRALIFNSWFISHEPLLSLSESIANFFVDETDWRAPLLQDSSVSIQERYYFKETQSPEGGPPWGDPLDWRKGGNALARRQISQRKVGTLRLGFPSVWRNPYVTSPAIYQQWGVGTDIYVKQELDNPALYSAQIKVYYSNLWFSPHPYAETLWESYSFVRQYVAKGYELNKGEIISQFDGQSYIAHDSLCRENRYKFVRGVTQFIRRFSVEAAILTYQLQGEYNRKTQHISYGKENELPAPLYYLGPDISISPASLQNFSVSYFEHEIEGVSFFLEEDHFNFLR